MKLTIRFSGNVACNLHLLRWFGTKSDGAVKLIYAVLQSKQLRDSAVCYWYFYNATGCNLSLIVFTTWNDVVKRAVCVTIISLFSSCCSRIGYFETCGFLLLRHDANYILQTCFVCCAIWSDLACSIHFFCLSRNCVKALNVLERGDVYK